MRTQSDPVEFAHRAIAKRYWTVTAVRAAQRAGFPSFAYTTGLTSLGHPELIIYGLEPGVAGSILNTVGHRIARGGGRLVEGELLSGFIDGDRDLMVIDALTTSDLRVATSVYGSVSAWQLVWPDAAGQYPWSAGYGIAKTVQPLAGLPAA
ncbi:uncharacterized protein DUF4262 [Williamsia limnetica]|jgi:hypothetical protein|uniref:Uncharacterized protein DUF4262 n=1 Tax=Williamsia limnetica TaxID=882452 RepID=A0A318RLZ3_WILLI|nr:DUF4262 domain-containing protein [Williamsia limnetica]PYE15413.1 uncharacterized protein DUF4262 [Williamsia limnetica]